MTEKEVLNTSQVEVQSTISKYKKTNLKQTGNNYIS